MRTATALLLAVVISAGAEAQTITMPKEVAAPVGRLASVVVKSDGADTKYFADDGIDVFREYDPDPKVIRLRLIGYKAGTYALRAITCRDNKLSEPALTTVVIGGATEPPVPPKPPVDPPAVAPAKLVVLVVEETAAAAATRGALFADPALAARMAAKGHRWRIADRDVVGPDGKPPADLTRFLAATAGKPFPQVFLVDEQGRTRVQTDLPTRAADLLDIITKYGG